LALIIVFIHSSSNDKHILEETDDKFIFPSGALRTGADNVITIVQVGILIILPVLLMTSI
jgi:hypothetical protein